MRAQDKVFVVTDAGGSIGSEIVITLLRRGANVAAVDLKEEGIAALKTRLGDQSENVSAHTINITDREAVNSLPHL